MSVRDHEYTHKHTSIHTALAFHTNACICACMSHCIYVCAYVYVQTDPYMLSSFPMLSDCVYHVRTRSKTLVVNTGHTCIRHTYYLYGMNHIAYFLLSYVVLRNA